MKANTTITKSFTAELNISEELLPYVSHVLLIKLMENNLITYGLDVVPIFLVTYPPEFDNLSTSSCFKKLAKFKHQFILNFSFYIEQERPTDSSFNGYPVYFQLVINYLNLEGKYEVQKHEIKIT